MKTKHWFGAYLLAGALSAFGVSLQAAELKVQSKISPQLWAAMNEKNISQFDVLIYLREQADLSGAKTLKTKLDKGRFVQKSLAGVARSSQKTLLHKLEKAHLPYRSYYIANAVALYGADQAMIKDLAARPEVARISWDKAVKVIADAQPAQLRDDQEALGVGDNIASTGANLVWSEFATKGEGIVVAGNDTGIEWDHPGLKPHYRGWDGTNAVHDYNWHDAIKKPLTRGKANSCGYDTATPCDDNGHGTHTLGTMVGDDGRGNQVGMAPGAKWIGCRNMDAGTGSPSTYLECFQFFLAPWPHGGDPVTDARPDLAPHIINNSWGCPTSEGCEGAEFLQTLSALREAGIMVVVSAGNSGSSCSSISDAPAHHIEETLVVGAHNHKSGNIASFSSRGPSKFDNKVGPHLTAPGENIRSTVKGGGHSGIFWSGTSMASPHVAGAIALLWSADQSLIGNFTGTIAALTDATTAKTSTQTCGGVPGSSVPNNTFGYGHLDVYKAVQKRLNR